MVLWRRFIQAIIVLSLVLAVIPIPVYEAGNYRTPITITEQSGNDLTDYQVKIVLDNTWDGWGHVSSDGSDIYFLDSSNNPLYYWIEEFDYSNQEATIWVKVPSIPASSSVTIYMYYGGDNPYASYNDPGNVFLWFDDFETDLSAWSLTIESGSIELSSDYVYTGSSSVKIVDTGSSSSDKNYMFRSVSFSESIICEVMFYDITGQSGSEAQVLRFDDGTNKVIVGVSEASIANDYGYRFGSTWYDTGIARSNGWHRLSIAWDDSVYKIYLDGQYIDSSPTGYGSPTYLELGSEWGEEASTFYYDTLIIRKYVDPEPSVSIGSSEAVGGGGPWFSASVSPSSVSVEPGDTISFDVNVTNTGNATGWIMVELRDHNNVCRDSINITLSSGAWQIVSLSTTAGDSERGDWTWYVLGYNDTTTFFNISVSVSIHYNVSYSYNYILNYTSSLSYSSIGTNLFSYWLNWSALRGYSIVDSNDYPRIWGTKYGLSLYINDSLVYQESGATVYVLYINFIYNVTTAPWPDIPDDYVKIYDYDTGQLITSVYIPDGNTSVLLYAGRYYRVEIPSAGSTLHGYGFRLQKYVINGVENPPSFMASEDMVMDVYFEITNNTHHHHR